jgi:mono/diheme cytochrome c family protein
VIDIDYFEHRMRLVIPVLFLLALPIPGAEFSAFFQTHCVKCHGADKSKADLRLDTLTPPWRGTTDTWNKIADVLQTGEMPPKKEPRPAPSDLAHMINWIGGQLANVQAPVLGLRRMNRTEYEHTVQDLLGIDTPLKDLLPEDGSVQGFDNVATGLGISSILMERYLDAANAAFEGMIRRIQPALPATRRIRLMDQKDNIAAVQKKKGGVIERDGAFIDFTPGWPGARVDPAHPIEEGIYRCRVAVFPHDQGDHRTLSAAVFTGPLFGDGKRHFQGIYDVTGTAANPRIIEFTTRMGELHAMRVLPWVFPEHVTWRDKHEPRPGVGILWAESYGPLDQPFPSLAQRKLFGESPTVSMEKGPSFYIRHRRGVRSHFVESSAPKDDVGRIIRSFVPRAFRRPVEKSLVDQFVNLALARLDAGSTFEEAVGAGVSAALCSPHFLLLNQDNIIGDFTIASRLSYFLWSSSPDDELLQLAAAGELSEPNARRAQVERMLDHPKRERFIEHFTGQWLNLRDIEFTTPDKKLYPEYDELLLRSMLAETRGFFRHVLTNDLSVLNFVDSEFAVLNQRLAEHYGIPGVRGHEQFRVVKIPPDHVRGGILTHASVLKVTANGTSTSPVIRGVWVLDKILGQPPLPPPAGVPAVEPDIRGAFTIREQLAKHRADESCARCHARIDPPGFALEQFNAIGGEREYYRSMGKNGKRVKNASYYVGQPVEKGGEWADGKRFGDFMEFRRQLLNQPETLARALAEKLLIYGTGRPVTHADRAAVDAIVDASRKNQFGLRSLIHAVVENEMFHRP